jgi:hypothetical protein
MPMTEVQAPLLSVNRFESEEEEEGEYSYHRQVVIEEQIHHAHFTVLERCVFFLCFILILLMFLCVGLVARINQAFDGPSLPIPQPTIPKNETCDPVKNNHHTIINVYLNFFLLDSMQKC